ncbi:hypothetical protein [Luteimonas aquatica]|uniref:hypothetical protein n=1 Tax=Luteimonas aquatica TaxID=450364 RepID=UPI001F58F709|nr:hypothetical protein [Luteimonas aquatica]
MIDKLLELGNGRLLIPIVAIAAGIVLVRGVFSLSRSRSADRRDFLDLFQKCGAENDLWLTVAVRHLAGAYLPSSLIRQLMAGTQPGRALVEISGAWGLLDMHDETGELYWRLKVFRMARIRKLAIWLLHALYFILAFAALGLAYLALRGRIEENSLWVAWMYSIIGACGAFFALFYGSALSDADKAARRWLGMQ